MNIVDPYFLKVENSLKAHMCPICLSQLDSTHTCPLDKHNYSKQLELLKSLNGHEPPRTTSVPTSIELL